MSAPSAAAAPSLESPPSVAAWSPARRFGFRVLFCYVVLYSFQLAGNSDFDWSWLTLAPLWHAIVRFIGHHLLHRDITTFTNGSGDTTFDWVLTGFCVVTALVAAAVWSALDRRRVEYERLHRILRLWVRYALAYQMLSYGFAKVFKLQFPAPGPARLSEPFGDASPMGLLWTFMGASLPYTIFGGAAEVLAGALLLFRRTTTLGALVTIAVMTNVAMLNYCYDVPVKLLSSQLLLMGVWLLLPDLRRLADVLFFHRPTQPAPDVWRPATRRGRWARGIIKYGLIAFLFGWNTVQAVEALHKYGDWAPRPPEYGGWDVTEFVRDGKPLPPGDRSGWRAVYVDRGWATIRPASGPPIIFHPSDKDKGKVELVERGSDAKTTRATFDRRAPDPQHLVLEGMWKGARLRATLQKRADEHWMLLERGFHFINEYPLNR